MNGGGGDSIFLSASGITGSKSIAMEHSIPVVCFQITCMNGILFILCSMRVDGFILFDASELHVVKIIVA
jgi:hypothetical protein